MLKIHCLTLLCIIILTETYNAAPIKNALENERETQILTKEYTIDNDGNYNFSFKTSNGISRSEIGTEMNKGQPNENVVVKGRYSYINANGEEHSFRYVADENGYRVSPLPRIVAEFVPASPVASLLGSRN